MTAEAKQRTCKERVRSHMNSRMGDLKALYRFHDLTVKQRYQFLDGNGYGTPDDPTDEDAINERLYEIQNEYGLSFDYVAPGTFSDQGRGYWRYQISYGGPSEELRFYATEGPSIDYIEFWFLDWRDGAKIKLSGDTLTTAAAMWDDFKELGTLEHTYNEATKDE